MTNAQTFDKRCIHASGRRVVHHRNRETHALPASSILVQSKFDYIKFEFDPGRRLHFSHSFSGTSIIDSRVLDHTM
jgi:hypothetical protein